MSALFALKALFLSVFWFLSCSLIAFWVLLYPLFVESKDKHKEHPEKAHWNSTCLDIFLRLFTWMFSSPGSYLLFASLLLLLRARFFPPFFVLGVHVFLRWVVMPWNAKAMHCIVMNSGDMYFSWFWLILLFFARVTSMNYFSAVWWERDASCQSDKVSGTHSEYSSNIWRKDYKPSNIVAPAKQTVMRHIFWEYCPLPVILRWKPGYVWF